MSSHISSDHHEVAQIKPFETDTLEPTRFGMIRHFSLLVYLFFMWIYARVMHEPSQVQEVLAIPREDPIIYLLGSENKHDFLYLNDLCLKTGMPLAYVSNGGNKLKYSTLWRRFIGLFSKRRQRYSADEIVAAVAERRPVLIFLDQYGRQERENLQRTEAIFDGLIHLCQNHPEMHIHLVPIGIIWERRAESYSKSAFNEIYGTPSRPSSVRRFLSALFSSVFSLFFQIGKPLCLIHHQNFQPDEHTTAQSLRQMLRDDISCMHTQVNGPRIKPHQQLLHEIITSDAFQTELRAIAQSQNESEETLITEAQKILEKSASKFSLVMIKLISSALTPMWSLIYNGLYYDNEKFNEIRELSKHYRLVFIPSHKSHVDYLVLSYLLFKHGVMPPHIVAGDNLNFSFIGGILRRGGAFFIKRSFKGEQLYSACIRHYIAKIMHEGYPVEFFIEGGRSRIGQVLQPKFGILRMIVQAAQADHSMPVKIIPCAITYEKVIEDMAYKKEQDGATKQKENITNLIRTTRLLISRYGQIYVSFADPIDLNEALHILPDQPEPAEDELVEKIDDMAFDLMERINRASTITTSSLLSCALLNDTAQMQQCRDILEVVSFILSLLIERNALITPVLQNALAASRVALLQLPSESGDHPIVTETADERHVDQHALIDALRIPVFETLKLLEKNKTIEISGKEDDPQIEIKSSKRLEISFYKNILLFALIEDIYMATAILSLPETERSKASILARYHAISELFSIEFSPSRDDVPFDDTLQRYIRRGWIHTENDRIEVFEDHRTHLEMLWHCIAAHFESYQTVFKSFEQFGESQEEAKYTAGLLENAKLAQKGLPESCSKVLYSHAVQKLVELHCFDVSYESSGRKYVKYLQKVNPLPDALSSLITDMSGIAR